MEDNTIETESPSGTITKPYLLEEKPANILENHRAKM